MIPTTLPNQAFNTNFLDIELTNEGAGIIDTSRGSYFKHIQTQDTTYTIQSQPGQTFVVVLKITTASVPSFSGASLSGELTTSAGAANTIVFFNNGEQVTGYVLV